MQWKMFNILDMPSNAETRRAFTLIELSIVLVIIGLIVGGVLVGRDLISAAAIRSQISQIEKYQQAVNTFRLKYGHLPGDVPEPEASRFGFLARPQYAGEGDGNGVIQGTMSGGWVCNICFASGELVYFWSDLGRARLIEGNFLPDSSYLDNLSHATNTTISNYFPAAKIGNGNYVYVLSGLIGAGYNVVPEASYFVLSRISSMNSGSGAWYANTSVGLAVKDAHAIDQKVDDGFPQGGKIMATYYNNAVNLSFMAWAAGDGASGANSGNPFWSATTAATAGSSTTCYDNNNVAGVTQQYSLTQNSGIGMNCALSFRFQ